MLSYYSIRDQQCTDKPELEMNSSFLEPGFISGKHFMLTSVPLHWPHLLSEEHKRLYSTQICNWASSHAFKAGKHHQPHFRDRETEAYKTCPYTSGKRMAELTFLFPHLCPSPNKTIASLNLLIQKQNNSLLLIAQPREGSWHAA